MPAGFRVVLDPATRRLDDRTLLGGWPARAMRLSSPGAEALAEIEKAPLQSARSRRLARRLTDTGLAHPRPPVGMLASVTVVIPVRDRREALDRCLSAVGTRHPVVVVDDGSRDRRSVAGIVAAHGAQLLRRQTAGGPAAARNTALAAIDSEVVAFVDSDCAPPPSWLERLAGHLADPLVAAVAPRIVPAAVDTSAQRYAASCGCLDLGRREARVVPLGPVAYLPTAALVVRRSALLDIADGPAVFDESMRYGEDVDLIWRLHAAGWRVRYDPSVEVAHAEPATWRGLVSRRFQYGTSAGPLAVRHPAATAPLVVQPAAAAPVAALIARRPLLALMAFVAGLAKPRQKDVDLGLPPSRVVAQLRLTAGSWISISRYLTHFAWPALVAAGVLGGGSRRSRQAAAGAVLLTPGLHAWWTRRPTGNPFALVVGSLADSMAYGAGVWAGCARGRTLAPLRPRLARSASAGER
jgi:mycofactocin system glycosyltransferase